jgi:hypothetical protein
MRETALNELPDVINSLLRLTYRSLPEQSRGAMQAEEDDPKLQLGLLVIDQATAARPGIQKNWAEHVGRCWPKIREGNDRARDIFQGPMRPDVRPVNGREGGVSVSNA